MEPPERRRKPSNLGSLKRKILPMLGIQRAYLQARASISVHEEEGTMGVSLDYNYSRHIETALLEVERKKAKAIMETKRQRMKMF